MIIKTQKDLDAALASGEAKFIELSEGHFVVSGCAEVTAYGSAQVRAYDAAQVTASSSARVRATKWCVITKYSRHVYARGGTRVKIPTLNNPRKWCDFHGLKPVRGVVVLFKGVNEHFTNCSGADYRPGSKPEAEDFDATTTYDRGLHFCGKPIDTLRYEPTAKHFVACPVRMDEMVVISPDYVKARRVVGKGCVEVNIDGNPV